MFSQNQTKLLVKNDVFGFPRATIQKPICCLSENSAHVNTLALQRMIY